MIIESKDLLLNHKITPGKDSQEFSDFWKHERDKCKYGITIDNVFLSGFLYYHLNFFKCQLDILDNGKIVRKLANPYLRDNEWIIDSYIRKAEEAKKGLCVLGSRRLAKSVFEASYISHRATFFKGTQNVIAGLNEPDIRIITSLVDEALVNLPIAFKKGRVEDNWKKEVVLGKKTTTERLVWSNIPIRNLDGGLNTEALAGLSPFSMVIDEIGKGNWLECFSAAIPGFATPYGWRCSPLCFGTSGDMEKAGDAQKVFDDPDVYNFLAVELKDEPGVTKSVFISGHYAHDFPKDNTPLNEYLNIPIENAPNLSKVNIQVTNFERADLMIDEERSQAKKSKENSALMKITMYHPKNRHELFLTDSNNNFPIEEINQWVEWLKENYEPRIVDLHTNPSTGKIEYRHSKKGMITQFPVKPETDKEAGILLFEEPIDNLPFGTYVGGLDLYNQNESSDRVNSLGAYYILKRMYDPLGEFQYCIVASYAARPQLKEFKENVVKMMKYYNAYTLVEHTNTEAIDWFIEKGMGNYLAEGLLIAKEANPFAGTGYNIKGIKPTPATQRHYMNQEVDYSKEILATKTMATGVEKEVLGLTRVLDTMLLEEWKNYKSKESTSKGVHDGNFDRIIAFGHALMLARHLDKVQPLVNFSLEPETKEFERNVVLHTPFQMHKRNAQTKTGNSFLGRPFILR